MSAEKPAHDQFEIVDFRETLSKFIADENKVYGKQSKPREKEPSMFSILSWDDPEKELHNYTVKNKEALQTGALNRFKYKIKKSQSSWVTENMDQFRKFAYSPEKKGLFMDLHEPKIFLKGRPQTAKAADSDKVVIEAVQPKEIFVKELPKQADEYLDQYTIKDIKSLPQVLEVIDGRIVDKHGELVKAPPKPQRVEEPKKDEIPQLPDTHPTEEANAEDQ